MPDNTPSLTPMQQMAHTQSNVLVKAAAATIEEVYSELLTNTDNAVLPEKVFQEYFLDYFMHPDKYPNSILPSKWAELAGGPYNEVDLIDSLGNTQCTVPGIVASPNIDYNGLGGLNFGEITATYMLKKLITSAHATNYITGALTNVSANVHADTNAYIDRWTIVFNRYSKQVPQTPTVTPKAAKPLTDLGIFDL